jgi:hypothetical protein
MNHETCEAVYELLKNFAQGSLRHFDLEEIKKAYPFHRLFFDEFALVAFKQERSIVTKMGQRLYPDLAKLIAREHYSEVSLEREIRGRLSRATVNVIEEIVRELRAGQRQPDRAREIEEILRASRVEGEEEIEVRIIADLYIGDFHRGPFFAEIKTPVPNLDICAQTKHKILTFIALFHERQPQGWLAFSYNPFLTRAGYRHSFTNEDHGLAARCPDRGRILG